MRLARPNSAGTKSTERMEAILTPNVQLPTPDGRPTPKRQFFLGIGGWELEVGVVTRLGDSSLLPACRFSCLQLMRLAIVYAPRLIRGDPHQSPGGLKSCVHGPLSLPS